MGGQSFRSVFVSDVYGNITVVNPREKYVDDYCDIPIKNIVNIIMSPHPSLSVYTHRIHLTFHAHYHNVMLVNSRLC